MEIIRLKDTSVETAAAKAAAVLASGGIVLYPTDTLYGLGAHVRHAGALERLRGVKVRHAKKPMSVIVANVEAMEEYVHLDDVARALANTHLPGALTLVLPAKAGVPTEVMLNSTIGIRIPADHFVLELARQLNEPFTATSANPSGMPTGSTVEAILAQFGPAMSHIDLVIDDGERAGGTPSTVVTVIDGAVHILREGAISRAELGL